MSPKGMRSLRIFTYEDPKTGKEEPAVHFSADNVHLGQVVTHSGQVMGRRNENVKEIERGSKSNHQYILIFSWKFADHGYEYRLATPQEQLSRRAIAVSRELINFRQ
jgi:hypothetical protein